MYKINKTWDELKAKGLGVRKVKQKGDCAYYDATEGRWMWKEEGFRAQTLHTSLGFHVSTHPCHSHIELETYFTLEHVDSWESLAETGYGYTDSESAEAVFYKGVWYFLGLTVEELSNAFDYSTGQTEFTTDKYFLPTEEDYQRIKDYLKESASPSVDQEETSGPAMVLDSLANHTGHRLLDDEIRTLDIDSLLNDTEAVTEDEVEKLYYYLAGWLGKYTVC